MAKPTLKDLIRKVKKKKQEPLALSLDKHFLKESYEDLTTERAPGWHPSSVSYDMCSRAEVISKRTPGLLPTPTPHEPSLIRIFWFGHAIHAMYQNKVFGPMGVLFGKWYNPKNGKTSVGFQPKRGWKYEEPGVSNKEYDIVGHVDGVLMLEDGPALLEVKTINSRSFDFLTNPRDYHVKQAQLYMSCEFDDLDMPMPKRTVMLYVNKNTSQEKEFWLDADKEKCASIFRDIKKVESSLQENSLPSREKECKYLSSARVKKCPCGITCMEVEGSGKSAYKQLMNINEFSCGK